jgi:predicted transposase/invertase (TIGR01784 family)
MANSPHDALFKASFGQPDIARSELELVLPADLCALLDFATLAVYPGSFVDEELQHTHSDLLYAVRTRTGEGGLVYVLFEHRSSPDATMPFRLLRYVVRIWEQWLRDHPGTKTLPVVLPVLLHHDDVAWNAAPELASMLDASPELLQASRPFVPHFRFVLDDLAALDAAALASRTLAVWPRLVQLALWASRSFPRLRRAAPFMRVLMGSLAEDERTSALLSQLFRYVYVTAAPDVDVRRIRTILHEVAGPEREEDVMNAADQLRAEGELRGRAEGELRGRAEGELRGLRVAIATALAARGLPLGDAGRARLASCVDATILTRWLTRSVTAASEADVFADDGAP